MLVNYPLEIQYSTEADHKYAEQERAKILANRYNKYCCVTGIGSLIETYEENIAFSYGI
jgi:hypothetical protein